MSTRANYSCEHHHMTGTLHFPPLMMYVDLNTSPYLAHKASSNLAFAFFKKNLVGQNPFPLKFLLHYISTRTSALIHVWLIAIWVIWHHYVCLSTSAKDFCHANSLVVGYCFLLNHQTLLLGFWLLQCLGLTLLISFLLFLTRTVSMLL